LLGINIKEIDRERRASSNPIRNKLLKYREDKSDLK
jgi:hypothetical protein